MSVRKSGSMPSARKTSDAHRVAIGGATGRMGRAIARLAAEHQCTIVGAFAAAGEAGQTVEGLRVAATPLEAMETAEVVIDFSHASATPTIAAACRARALPMVCGTTNLDDAGQHALEELAKVAAVLWSPNMSFGVQLLADMVEMAVRRLGVGFDVEVLETHHGRKVDAPSGAGS
ncbi:MAG: hypothetical protein NVSMB47_07300 [Polyangiales bacterium]